MRGLRGDASCEQPLEDAAVDRRERLEVGDARRARSSLWIVALIGPELDDLGADVGDEAAVRRAARAVEARA